MKTRFLCETCSREVAFDASVCPYCGTIFAAVKCPMCDFEGKINLFHDGCPQCHYHGEKLSQLINSAARPLTARTTRTFKSRKQRGKKGRQITFTDRFYLICSFFLASLTIFLLFLLFFKH